MNPWEQLDARARMALEFQLIEDTLDRIEDVIDGLRKDHDDLYQRREKLYQQLRWSSPEYKGPYKGVSTQNG